MKTPSAPSTSLANQFPDKNVEILTGEVVVIDIDILDSANALRMQSLALEIIGQTDLIRIGRDPKRALIYRGIERRKQRIGEVEILSKGQQLAAYGIHPDTGQPYHWPLESLIDCPLDQLPLAEEDNILSFVIEAGHIQNLPQTQRNHGQPVGFRNTRLFNRLRREAPEFTHIDDLGNWALARNENETAPRGPLVDKEVKSIVRSVWKYKVEGRLFIPGQQVTMLPMKYNQIIDAQNAPKSIDLLALLKSTRAPEAHFTIPQVATAKILKCGTDTLRAAIEYLIEAKFIECVWTDKSSNARKKAHQYRFRTDSQNLSS